MAIINNVISWYFRNRNSQLEYEMKHAVRNQETTLVNLLKDAENTEWGKKYNYKNIKNYEDFKAAVPISNYDEIKDWITKTMNGEQNLLWPSEINWFAKSSGTTSDKSKFIPVSFETLENCHFQGGRDVLTFYTNAYPDTKIFNGKGLVIGGSQSVNSMNDQTRFGDLSAVLMSNLPFWVDFLRTPDKSIALMEDWEVKLEKMALATMDEDVTNISGVPTWTLLLIQRILELKGKTSILDVWPNLELYIHGGVNFEPYRNQFEQLTYPKKINYLETYNASEGFFGIQYKQDSSDLLLLTNYGTFYEFIPLDEFTQGNYENSISLKDVQANITYAVIISNNSGLWRYVLGDTIRFSHTKPHTFRIIGRTKHFINAFGEELMIENAETALSKACAHTEAKVKEYTAAPIYFEKGKSGGHEWLIEFDKTPKDIEYFREILDQELKKANSDYEAKRHKDIALKPPIIKIMKTGSFHNWLKQKGKLGGQHKIPRLSNDRTIIEEILANHS